MMEERKKFARKTAIIVLVMAVLAFVSMLAPSQITLENTPNNLLFRLGILSELLVPLLEVVISVMLFKIFADANKMLVMISVTSRIIMAVVQAINVVVHLTAFSIVQNNTLGLPVEQVPTVISILGQFHTYGIFIWQAFFALHLVLLGYVAIKSHYVPKAIGIALTVSCIGYLAESTIGILGINNPVLNSVITVLLVVSTLAELTFTFWLLIKGVNVQNNGQNFAQLF